MPIGDRAILEITVDRLIESGISDITLCVGHLAHLIEARVQRPPAKCPTFDTCERRHLWAPRARFVSSRISTETFLLMNGDLLTDLDFSELIEAHRRAGNVVTIATHERRDTIDYGVLHVEDGEFPRLLRYEEKPEIALTVSMGIYVMEPRCCEHIPAGYFDFPDLIRALLDNGSGSERSRSRVTGSTSGGVTTTSRRSRSGRSEKPATHRRVDVSSGRLSAKGSEIAPDPSSAINSSMPPGTVRVVA